MDELKMISIQDMIYEVRGIKVMLDRDLARLYGVDVKVLNQVIKRNLIRFPYDFMFQLTQNEWEILRSQIVTANSNISKIRYLPYVFTEQGVSMLSTVLNSERAIKVNINIMRAFVQMRKFVFSQNNTNEQISELRKLLMLHIENSDNKFSEHDEAIRQIILALNNLIEKPKETRIIGFQKE